MVRSRPLPDRPTRAASEAQRRAWRRARVRDAARLLPVLGLGLLLLPDLILSGSDAAVGATGAWGVYLFLAWTALIAIAILLSRLMSDQEAEGGPPGP